MQEMEILANEVQQLKDEIVELRREIRALESTMSGLSGTGSEDLVGAILNLTTELNKQRTR